ASVLQVARASLRSSDAIGQGISLIALADVPGIQARAAARRRARWLCRTIVGTVYTILIPILADEPDMLALSERKAAPRIDQPARRRRDSARFDDDERFRLRIAHGRQAKKRGYADGLRNQSSREAQPCAIAPRNLDHRRPRKRAPNWPARNPFTPLKNGTS